MDSYEIREFLKVLSPWQKIKLFASSVYSFFIPYQRKQSPYPEPLIQTKITHDDDHYLLRMHKEKWAIIANIRDSVSLDQLAVIGNQIINFHNYYSLLVDKTTIDTHTENIYDFHSAKTEEIKKASLQRTSS